MSTPAIRASRFDGSRVTTSAGATKTLYRGVATSQIGSNEAGRKRAIKGNNSEDGHIVPRASAAFPWDGAAASYATRAIMNDGIASRSRSDANFPERRGNEIFIEQLIPNGNAFRSFRSGNAVLCCIYIYLRIQCIHYHVLI